MVDTLPRPFQKKSMGNNKSQLTGSIYYVPDISQSDVYILTHLILTTPYIRLLYLHFTDGKIEAQRLSNFPDV